MIAQLTPIEETQVGKELIEKGIEKGAVKIALRMIGAGKSDEEIAELTDLSVNLIKGLRKEANG